MNITTCDDKMVSGATRKGRPYTLTEQQQQLVCTWVRQDRMKHAAVLTRANVDSSDASRLRIPVYTR